MLQKSPTLLPKVAKIFKGLYDIDIVEEEAVLQWNKETRAAEVKAKCQPFIDWLR